MKKSAEIVSVELSDLKPYPGNPRKISKDQMDKLKEKISRYGDVGIITIDEHNQVVGGNQRLQAMRELGITGPIKARQLIGYGEKEKREINIILNKADGDWDSILLTDFVMDLSDLVTDGLDLIKTPLLHENKEKEITELETENKCPSCGYEW